MLIDLYKKVTKHLGLVLGEEGTRQSVIKYITSTVEERIKYESQIQEDKFKSVSMNTGKIKPICRDCKEPLIEYDIIHFSNQCSACHEELIALSDGSYSPWDD